MTGSCGYVILQSRAGRARTTSAALTRPGAEVCAALAQRTSANPDCRGAAASLELGTFTGRPRLARAPPSASGPARAPASLRSGPPVARGEGTHRRASLTPEAAGGQKKAVGAEAPKPLDSARVWSRSETQSAHEGAGAAYQAVPPGAPYSSEPACNRRNCHTTQHATSFRARRSDDAISLRQKVTPPYRGFCSQLRPPHAEWSMSADGRERAHVTLSGPDCWAGARTRTGLPGLGLCPMFQHGSAKPSNPKVCGSAELPGCWCIPITRELSIFREKK
ncbi:PREDICTED: uncharacterized protein LOC106150057 [Chinchilla lanigera]|uniref:uncharacterized protein LOC106150057 n=1 Tax=Chinchilla lanigera TaxID=34839 RepID=UPI000696A84A|nr:PREDICTED: uncharacterized protein LOC106150057 [Chinchilla lanigera]